MWRKQILVQSYSSRRFHINEVIITLYINDLVYSYMISVEIEVDQLKWRVSGH